MATNTTTNAEKCVLVIFRIESGDEVSVAGVFVLEHVPNCSQPMSVLKRSSATSTALVRQLLAALLCQMGSGSSNAVGMLRRLLLLLLLLLLLQEQQR